ncbi:MAG: barrel protein [Subtercola sp.]|nr:barrel protein [Subtercola sp.]
MTSNQKYGAGIWHFATYVDRYATDGYGEPRSVIDAIDIAGQVRDLSVVDLNYPYFGGEFSNEQVKEALDRNNLGVIGITPEMYTREFAKGAFTNPDPGVRRRANELINEAADVVRFFGADYVKLWPGQDGWDYPFQVDHGALWKNSLDGVGQLASENPDLKFVIEYKPREPRVHMSFDSVSRTLLGIEKIGLPNVGILLDFGHALFGGSRRRIRPSSPSTTGACSAWT